MPIESILYVGFVIAALIEFAIVLTYAEWASKHPKPDKIPTLVHARKTKPVHRAPANTVRDKAA